MASRIDITIIQPLTTLTDYDGPPFEYYFWRETLSGPYTRSVPTSWPARFIIDLMVFGLREAITYFHTYAFVHDPAELVDGSVHLYHDLARLYLSNVPRLEASSDEVIQRLMLFVRGRHGEGIA